jgi:hypothetical protein
MAATSTTSPRYTIISADCHAGGNHAQYREYLSAEHQATFDAWRGKYKNPFRDLQAAVLPHGRGHRARPGAR